MPSAWWFRWPTHESLLRRVGVVESDLHCILPLRDVGAYRVELWDFVARQELSLAVGLPDRVDAAREPHCRDEEQGRERDVAPEVKGKAEHRFHRFASPTGREAFRLISLNPGL